MPSTLNRVVWAQLGGPEVVLPQRLLLYVTSCFLSKSLQSGSLVTLNVCVVPSAPFTVPDAVSLQELLETSLPTMRDAKLVATIVSALTT
eukprot:4493081-Pleurochrysis_carterae.AAC.2